MSTVVELAPEEVELIARVVGAYGTCPAARDVPTIERVLEVLTPSVSDAHTDGVA